MMIKSERLKKLEIDLSELEQWLSLGFVPKKEIVKHQKEIDLLKEKIVEEKERIRFLKENDITEENIAAKRFPQMRPASPDMGNMTLDHSNESLTDLEPENETDFHKFNSTEEEEEKEEQESRVNMDDDEEEESNPYSDKNRWKRGILENLDTDNW